MKLNFKNKTCILLAPCVLTMFSYYFFIKQPEISVPDVPFYFIRHGQTDDNAQNRVTGVTDTPLNKVGIAQAHKAADLLEQANISVIVSSPLKRALQTASIIAEKINKPIIVMQEFMERSFGPAEGKRMGEYLLDWIHNRFIIPGAEDYDLFKRRVIVGLKKSLLLPAPVLIVSHGLVFDIIQEVLGLDHPLPLENATPVYIHKKDFSQTYLLEYL